MLTRPSVGGPLGEPARCPSGELLAYRRRMTFSLVVRQGTAFGVAVASKFLAAGALVPAIDGAVGAVASQALAKVSSKADVLAALSAGLDAAQAIAQVTAADAAREERQLGVVGRHSEATFTGSGCLPWSGGRAGSDSVTAYAVQGNVLTGPQVIDAMEQTWVGGDGMPIERRLYAALLAGDRAGGDRRGRQSAALLVIDPGRGYDGSGVVCDLRVDDHPDATVELGRLLEVSELLFGEPEDVQPWTADLRAEVIAAVARLGYVADHAGFERWAGTENLENRLTPQGIDARVLEVLRRQSAAAG